MSDNGAHGTRGLSKGRVEAFSDGVLAVAITLLVLDLHVTVGKASLAAQLRHDWPTYGAYLISFFYIGVVWVNHHALFSLARRLDRTVVFYNLVLLMFVTTIPFTTSTLAQYLRVGGTDERLAVVLYGVSTEGMAVLFTVILHRFLAHDLMHRPATRAESRAALRRFGVGTLIYPAVTAVGLWSPELMLICYAVLTGFYVREQTPVLPES